MATTLYNAEALVAGTTMASAEITDVGNLSIDVDLAAIVNPNHSPIEFILKAHLGSNSYKVLRNYSTDPAEIIKGVVYNDGFRDVINGIDSEKVKLYVKVPTGVTGTMTVVYNKTVNAIPSA